MRNITVSVDDATYRRARVCAAELDTSVSALVREYLGALTGDDSPQDDTESHDDQSTTAAPAASIRQHVQHLLDEARARAAAVAGRPISDVHELAEFRRQLLNDVASDFQAKGIGLHMPGIVNREEIYDRSRARIEAMLAAAEARGEELKGELADLKASLEGANPPEDAFKVQR